MKHSLTTALCILLCVLLTILAVCIGSVRGWSREREQMLQAFDPGGKIYEQLDLRAMDAANLAVVAARHLPADDTAVQSLQQARHTLMDAQATLRDKVYADSVLSSSASTLAQTLPALASVQASARDRAYISALTRTLSESATIAEDYAQFAQAFNQRLTNSVTGWLAMRLGVHMLEQ